MKRGAVVLTPFSFTDLTGQKVRPATIISRSARTGSDVILAYISSKVSLPALPSEVVVEAVLPAFSQTGLKVSSSVKLDKLVTVFKNILLRELGEFPQELMKLVNEKLRYTLHL